MICRECAEAGDVNRKRYDMDQPLVLHPDDCECACGHEVTAEWEKQFRVKPPWLKKVQETEVL